MELVINAVLHGQLPSIVHQQGAELALTFLGDTKGRFEANVKKLGKKVNATLIQECDVADDNSIQSLIEALNNHWGEMDFLIHSLAFADQKDLQSRLFKYQPKWFCQSS